MELSSEEDILLILWVIFSFSPVRLSVIDIYLLLSIKPIGKQIEMKFALNNESCSLVWSWAYVGYRSVEFCIGIVNVRPIAEEEGMKEKVLASNEKTLFFFSSYFNLLLWLLHSHQDRKLQSQIRSKSIVLCWTCIPIT